MQAQEHIVLHLKASAFMTTNKGRLIMNLENIVNLLESHNNITSPEGLRTIENLGNNLFENWDYIEGLTSYTRPLDLIEHCNVKIAKDYICYNCADNEINKAGYVITVQQMYHESRHVQQFTEEMKNISLDDDTMTNIARRHLIDTFYGSIAGSTYKIAPCEMDAEAYGLKKALEHFENDQFVSKAEAGNILFQFMTAPELGHMEQLEPYDVKSIDDVIHAFEDMKEKNIHIPYTIEAIENLPEHDLSKEFLTEPVFKTHRQEFDKAQDGLIQDKIMEQTIVLARPYMIHAIPRLEEELVNCQKQMDRRLFIPKTDAIPASKIRYANQELEDDGFTDAVNSISINTENKEEAL